MAICCAELCWILRAELLLFILGDKSGLEDKVVYSCCWGVNILVVLLLCW
jgi:hypothetical protein